MRAFSPHARGWPGEGRQGWHPVPGRGECSPRTRGDGPRQWRRWTPEDLGSPRTRGDGPIGSGPVGTVCGVLPARAGMARRKATKANWRLLVLPARAGMARGLRPPQFPNTRFSPHARGWPGYGGRVFVSTLTFSPHARGWPAGSGRGGPR